MKKLYCHEPYKSSDICSGCVRDVDLQDIVEDTEFGIYKKITSLTTKPDTCTGYLQQFLPQEYNHKRRL